MDTDAEKKLRRFLDGRLKEIQDSRPQLPPVELDARNAAGKKLRRFLDGRLKEIQDSRPQLPPVELDARNAAGDSC